jgi:hypothetical protein
MSVHSPTSERYLTDSQGGRIAVVLDIDEYEMLLDQRDELDAIHAYDKTKASGEERIPFEKAKEETKPGKQ